jgi:hypothetical protein
VDTRAADASPRGYSTQELPGANLEAEAYFTRPWAAAMRLSRLYAVVFEPNELR